MSDHSSTQGIGKLNSGVKSGGKVSRPTASSTQNEHVFKKGSKKPT